MAKADTSAARAPRGTKPVAQAFFTALESAPEASRAAIAKAALAMIRDDMKMRREKLKIAAEKEKEKARKAASASKAAPAPKAAEPAPAKTKSAASKSNGAEHTPAPVKRRGRKPAEAPTTAS